MTQEQQIMYQELISELRENLTLALTKCMVEWRKAGELPRRQKKATRSRIGEDVTGIVVNAAEEGIVSGTAAIYILKKWGK